MTVGAFLRSHWRLIAAVTAFDAFACVMVFVLGCGLHAVFAVACALFTGLLVGLAAEYARAKRFYSELDCLSRSLEHPYQIPSLVKKPQSADQALVYDALQTMGVASASEVARAQAAQNENREYMEAWVHEVKTPLAAAQLVAERVPEPESSQLKRELDRANRQVEQVLWYARTLSAEVDYRVHPLELLQVVREVCRQNARFLIEQGVQPVIQLPQGLTVFADEKQTAFIVSQAVVNAAKYGATRITFSSQEAADDAGGKQVALLVADNGRGIAAEDLPRVFERGFTGAHGREEGSSTGMGLYLAATLSQKLGLGLSLSSEIGQGTVFKLVFPFDDRRAWQNLTQA
ncbi:MAG: ATP-binding protein [Eggerthellales bacterium]|nr:ATP-binding protein [Eggerthellales bacterium]